jgi:predicted transposase YdaD
MSYDNLTKILAEKHPERFATGLLGTPQTSVEILLLPPSKDTI